MGFQINKGVGAPLDFFGLKSQYIIYFMIGMVLAFIFFFVFQFVNKVLAFVVGGTIAVVVYFLCHWANKKYGLSGVSIKMSHSMLPNRMTAKRARDIVKISKKL
ncbi:MAG: DUF4133 domain-containing protein [Bacilli bacterium]|nr:DUF4133 domain-containing protein [Bacilli bacterium]